MFGSAAHIVWPKDLLIAIANSCGVNCWTWCGSTCNISNHLDNFYSFFIPVASVDISGTECIAAFFIGIFLFLITLSFFSYFLSVLSIGETLMFTIFRNKSDNDNILERKDEEELEVEAVDDIMDDGGDEL